MKKVVFTVVLLVLSLIIAYGCTKPVDKEGNKAQEPPKQEEPIVSTDKKEEATEDKKDESDVAIEKIMSNMYMTKSKADYPEAFKAKGESDSVTMVTYPANVLNNNIEFEKLIPCYEFDFENKTLEDIVAIKSLKDSLIPAKIEDIKQIGDKQDPELYAPSVKPVGAYYMEANHAQEVPHYYQMSIYQNDEDAALFAIEPYDLLSGVEHKITDLPPNIVQSLKDSKLNLDKTEAYFISATSPIGAGILFADDNTEYYYPLCFYATVFSYYKDELYSHDEIMDIWNTTGKGAMGYLNQNVQAIAERPQKAVEMHESLFGMINPYPELDREQWDLSTVDFKGLSPEGMSWVGPQELSAKALCWFFIKNYRELPYKEADMNSEDYEKTAADSPDEVIIKFLMEHFDLTEDYLKTLIQTPEFKEAAKIQANGFYYPTITIENVEYQGDGTTKVKYLCHYSDYTKTLVSKDDDPLAHYKYDYTVYYAYENQLVYSPTTFSFVFKNSDVLEVYDQAKKDTLAKDLEAKRNASYQLNV